MPKYFNRDLGELAHQLALSPRRLRQSQIDGIERLLGLIDAAKAYPYEFVCYHITGFHKRGAGTSASIPGKALAHDLVWMASEITRRAKLPASGVAGAFLLHEQTAAHLRVSTKTIHRWRGLGLMGIWVTFEDGVNRLVFPRRALDRFVARHAAMVERAASFRQLSDAERVQIVSRAHAILSTRSLKLHTVARKIAAETGRGVETVRYTLRRHEAQGGQPRLFDRGGAGHALCERDLSMWSCHEAGDSVEAIGRAFQCTAADVARTLRRVQLLKWSQLPLEHMHNELFDAPGADALILDVPEPPPRRDAPPSIPDGLPAYLHSLYTVPLLTFEQEQDLFRRYNYLKCKTARQIASLDPDSVTDEALASVRTALDQISGLRQRLVRANLRLVVSIARRHVGWSPRFFEIISDGNMSLMRAVEKFDYARGYRFSTYASWSIVKNYARSIPEGFHHAARYVTGQDAVLAAQADDRTEPEPSSDRRRIREMIDAGLETLGARERDIVTAHFGLASGGAASKTLEQLGRQYGVTKERIRQIETRALRRLREALAPSLQDALPG
ncbi:MAG: sigma-70 family RNA polymerase sigma factor [Phycisphaerae bacterium]